MIDNTLPQPISQLPRPEGLRAWLPAIAIVIGLPIMALVTTKLIILPPLQHSLSTAEFDASAQYGMAPHIAIVPFQSIASATSQPAIKCVGLVSHSPAVKKNVARHEAALTQLTAAALANVKGSDLYNKDVLHAKQAQLITEYNRELGAPLISEVCIALNH